MQELQLLKDKLDVLVKRYSATEAENTRLRQTVAEQAQLIGTLNHKLSGLEENMVAVHMGQNVFEGKEKERMRKQIDGVINEIDKIMNTLHD